MKEYGEDESKEVEVKGNGKKDNKSKKDYFEKINVIIVFR
jgi:hypothetical protein